METSLLETVAAHEQKLLAEVDTTEAEGRALVESAHAEAASLLAQAHRSLDRDVAGLRRQAAAQRDEDSRRIEESAAQEVRAIHAALADRRAAVESEILGFLLPQRHQ